MKEQQYTAAEVSIYSGTGTRQLATLLLQATRVSYQGVCAVSVDNHTPWLRLVHGRVISMCTGMATVRRLNGTDISVTDWNGDGTETERYGHQRYGRR